MRLAVRTTQAAVWAMVLSLAVSESLASGVGASLYVPGKSRPAVQQTSCQTGACGPVSGCDGCQRLGFACVDHATVPPCTAEGGCYPNRSNFGYTKTRWRQWPGANYGSGASPQVAGPSDQLPAVEEPTPEDEDRQAPPPIEDVESPSAADEGNASPGFGEEGPGAEVTLPPLPEGPLPTPRPSAPQFQDPPPFQNQNNSPPALPFGFDSRGPAPSDSEWNAPPAPFTKVPANLPRPAAGDNAPPPLPRGFTGTTPEQLLRRLPVTRPIGRYDGQVQPASAQTPIR